MSVYFDAAVVFVTNSSLNKSEELVINNTAGSWFLLRTNFTESDLFHLNTYYTSRYLQQRSNTYFKHGAGSKNGHFKVLIYRTKMYRSSVFCYRGSPDSTNFVLPGNRTIAKIVLSGDCLVLKSQFMTFGFSKSHFFPHF